METDKEQEEIEETSIVDTIEADQVEMKQSCAMNVFAEEVHMDQAAAGIVRGEKVRMENSIALIISADEIEGDVKALFTPAAALIAGGAILVGLLIWSRR